MTVPLTNTGTPSGERRRAMWLETMEQIPVFTALPFSAAGAQGSSGLLQSDSLSKQSGQISLSESCHD